MDAFDGNRSAGDRKISARRNMPIVTSVRSLAASLATFALMSLTVCGVPEQDAPPVVPDVQRLGPQVGVRVPDFTLTDQQGRPRTLASLFGRSGLMLVFFRSADW